MITDRLGGRTFAALAIFAAVMVSMVAPAAAAGQSLNHDSEQAPETQVEVDVTKATHNMTWGQSATAARTYLQDDGSTGTLEAQVNTTVDNPYTLNYAEIEASEYNAFPRDKSDVSAIDSTEWSSDMSSSTGTASLSDTETAPGVEGVQVSTSGQGSGDVAVFTFSNFTVSSDEDRRVGQAVYNVDSVDSGASYAIRFVDADGDYKELHSDSTVADGVVQQDRLGDLTTQGSGDGTFNDIESVEVRVTDADAQLTLVGLNAEKTSTWDIGSERVDDDGDGDLETVEVGDSYAGGDVSLETLSSMGDTFSSATLHHMTVPMQFTGELAGSDDVAVNTTEDSSVEGGAYPGYAGTATTYLSLDLPSAYDLSYSSAELVDTQSVNSNRLLGVEYAEGVSDDTEFGNISDSSYTDVTGSYGSEGDEVSLDTTVSVGSNMVVKYDYKLTEDELSNYVTDGSGGAGGGAMGGFGSNLPLIGGIIAGLAALLKRVG